MGALVNIIKHHQPSLSLWDYLSLLGFVVYMILSIIKSKICTYPQSSSSEEKTTKRKLSRKALLILLKPYVWPDATSSSWINRLLVITFQQWLWWRRKRCCWWWPPTTWRGGKGGRFPTRLTRSDTDQLDLTQLRWTGSKIRIFCMNVVEIFRTSYKWMPYILLLILKYLFTMYQYSYISMYSFE